MRTVAVIGRFVRYGLSLILLATALPAGAWAAETGFLSRTFVDADGEHRYAVYVPKAYDGRTPWPVVLYLHGAGYSGTDGQRQLNSGLAAVIRTERDFPAIVVFPQSENDDLPLLRRWLARSPDGRRALQILNEVERDFAVDRSRCVLAGWSMGGYGAWSLAAAEPDRWSAVVAVSGGGQLDLAPHIAAPVWAIHGGADRAISVQQSRDLVNAAQQAGRRAVLTELPGIGHDAWRYAFLSTAVRDWMLAQQPGVPDSRRLEQETTAFAASGQADALDGEFRPALIIPRAISVRVGNDVLRTLACGAPAAIDPQMLRGPIDDVIFDFTAAGETFHVTQEQLTFDVTLDRVLVQTEASGVVRLRAGLHPLTITIGATHVRSPTRSADAGPIAIRMGVRYPLWVNLALRPRVADDRLRLRIEQADFQIPDSNWIVSEPETISVSGPDLTPELAKIALQGGLYSRRHQIEDCVRNFLPKLVDRLEERLQPAGVDRIVATVWPMPVFRPRLRLQPDDISVDGDGMSLALNLAAAALNSQQRPGQPTVTAPMGPRAGELARSRDLELGIAPGVLQALSGMIVDADAARIDVRDMPQPQFALLGDRSELTRVLPELARGAAGLQLRTELDLAAPFVVQRGAIATPIQFTSTDDAATPEGEPSTPALPGGNAGESLHADFEIPQLVVRVLARDDDAQADWRPYATFDVRLRQSAIVELACDGRHPCRAQLSWAGEPDIDVAGGYVHATASAAESVNHERLADLLKDGWRAWTNKDALVQGEVPDLTLGDARLRIQALNWRDSEMVARYGTPDTRITNSGTRLIDYAVRSPYSDWGSRRQLKPGQTDVYAVHSRLIVHRFPEPVENALDAPVGGELDLASPAQ